MFDIQSLASRFASKYQAIPIAGCWLWTGALQNGYGKLIVRRGDRTKTFVYAHRVSWELHKGPITEGLYVCHHCDVPSCVNPEHLFLGTQLENMHDASRKGKMVKGFQDVWGCGHAPITLPCGNRICRICMRAYRREWERKRRRALGIKPRRNT